MTASPNAARAADLMLAAARIDSEAASRRSDPLYEADKRRARQLRERVNSPPPVYIQEVGAGGELVPASILGENSRALELRDTVNDPNYITVDASRDRLELANEAGCLEEALDAAESIDAQNSLERMLAHQLAASHRSSMKMTEHLNACLGRLDHVYPEDRERANVQATRLAGAIARMNGSFQTGMVTLQKLRTGGRQEVHVIRQEVQVNEGGQAVIAGTIPHPRDDNG